MKIYIISLMIGILFTACYPGTNLSQRVFIGTPTPYFTLTPTPPPTPTPTPPPTPPPTPTPSPPPTPSTIVYETPTPEKTFEIPIPSPTPYPLPPSIEIIDNQIIPKFDNLNRPIPQILNPP